MKDRARLPFILGFLAPALGLFGFFVLQAVVQAVQYSFYDWSGLAGGAKTVGLGNYTELINDELFRQALSHNLLLAGLGGLAAMVLALVSAHMIQGNSFLSRLLRAVYLMPHITSVVAVCVLWYFIFSPESGLLNMVLQLVGLGQAKVPWLGQKSTALASVGTTFVWYMMGFYVMLFSAGIGAIDREVREAAECDGSIGLHQFCKVTWPLLWSIKRVALLNYLIAALNIFAFVFLMTNGGPDRASDVSMTYLYEQGFVNSRMGYASTIAVVNLLVMSVLVALTMAFLKRDPTAARKSV